MKNLIILNITLFFTTIGFAQQNDFKFKGELPQENFILLDGEQDNITPENANKIPLRNRIYAMMDSSGKILLNGHLVPLATIKESLKYIYTNPDKHQHLPKKIEDAVLFTNLMNWGDPFSQNELTAFKMRFIFSALAEIHYDILVNEVHTKLNKTLDDLTLEDLKMIDRGLNIKTAFINYPVLDEGIKIKLPPWAEEEKEPQQLKKRNVLRVVINSKNQLFVRGEEMKVEDLKAATKKFIINPNQEEDLAENPKNAIVSLQNDRGTSYDVYISVYNELKAAYTELWDESAEEKYGKAYNELSKEEQKEIRNEIPLVISEAEPTSF